MAATNPVSGFTQDYTDPGSGIVITGAWIQIKNILYVPSGYCLVVSDVYKDQSSYQSGMSPVFQNIRYEADYNDSSWNSYFDAAVMDGANKDIQAQAILFLQNNIEIGKR